MKVGKVVYGKIAFRFFNIRAEFSIIFASYKIMRKLILNHFNRYKWEKINLLFLLGKISVKL